AARARRFDEATEARVVRGELACRRAQGLVALQELLQLGVRRRKSTRGEIDVGIQNPGLVAVRVLPIEPRELVERLARAVVVLRLVAGGGRLVERLGQVVRVARHEVAVVARIVEAVLLVGDAAETEAREVSDAEKVAAAEQRRIARR